MRCWVRMWLSNTGTDTVKPDGPNMSKCSVTRWTAPPRCPVPQRNTQTRNPRAPVTRQTARDTDRKCPLRSACTQMTISGQVKRSGWNPVQQPTQPPARNHTVSSTSPGRGPVCRTHQYIYDFHADHLISHRWRDVVSSAHILRTPSTPRGITRLTTGCPVFVLPSACCVCLTSTSASQHQAPAAAFK